jgi:ketosteroid isomerase-like protein
MAPNAMTMTDADLVDRLAGRLVQALSEPKLEILDELLSDDFVIWYNFSDSMLDRAAALAFFGGYFTKVRVRYRDIVKTPTAGGWVQQHLVDADGADGFVIRGLPVCMVIALDGERITRIDEYMDSVQTAGFDASQMKQG